MLYFFLRDNLFLFEVIEHGADDGYRRRLGRVAQLSDEKHIGHVVKDHDHDGHQQRHRHGEDGSPDRPVPEQLFVFSVPTVHRPIPRKSAYLPFRAVIIPDPGPVHKKQYCDNCRDNGLTERNAMHPVLHTPKLTPTRTPTRVVQNCFSLFAVVGKPSYNLRFCPSLIRENT